MTNITAAGDWKKSTGGRGMIHEVKVPSGNVCRALRPGMQEFLTLGFMPESLMGIMSKHIEAASKGRETDYGTVAKDLDGFLSDPTKLRDIITLADNVVCYIVVEPKVHSTPDSGSDRNPELLYVDEVDLEDKMFLFQWATGGAETVEPFREEQAELMEHLANGEGAGENS